MMKFFRAVLVMSHFALLSACGGGGGSAGNTSGVALFSTAAEKVTILPGAAQTYNVGGGIPGYAATSSSGAATASINGKVLTITGSGSGSAVVTITDAAGTKVAINVTVGTGSEFFTTAPEKLSVGIGATTSTFIAGGGSGIYIVASGNRQIVTVTQSGSQFYLSGVSVGTTTVTVSDNAGGSRKIDVTVGSGIDLYTTAPSAVTVAVGTSSAIYSIGGGSQVYSVSSGDQGIATVGISNRNEFIITGKTGGSTVIIVKDSLGKSVNVDVVVGSKTKLFSTAASDIKLDVGGSNIFKVGGGTTIYNVGSSNNAVATATLSGNDLTIVGLSTGAAAIIVTDSASNTLTINVAVGAGAVTPLFTSAGSDIVVSLGSQPSFSVAGGKAPYSISSTNSSVVSTAINGGTMTITGISEGSAKVILTDMAGAKVSVNVTVGTGLVVPLFTTAPTTVTIAPLSVATYTVGGGTAPYTFTSNNTAVASVVGNGKTFNVAGVINGTASVIVRDAVGSSTSIDVTVSDGRVIPLYTTAPAAITIGVGSPIPYTIGGGKAPYTVTSSNVAVATVASSLNTVTVTGLSAGTGSFIIRDAEGTIVTVNLTVTTGAQVPLFTTAPSSIVLATGSTSTFVVSGGSAPYTVTTSDSLVASVSIGGPKGADFTITGGVGGAATVVLHDALGATVSIAVSINRNAAVPLFVTAPPSLSIATGSVALTYAIGGGTGPYTVSSSNPLVASGSIVGSSSFSITGNSIGLATIVVRDAVGTMVSVNVNVGTTVVLFTTAPSSVTVTSGTAVSYIASGGTGPYTVTSSNTAVATVVPSSGSFASAFTINGVSAGAAQVVVRDSIGASVSVSLTVTATALIPIDVLPGDVTAAVGDVLSFQVSGGTAPFTLVNNNPSIASISTTSIVSSGGNFTAKLLNVGATIVSIVDAQGQVKKVTITATAANSQLRISPSSFTIGEDSTAAVDLTIYGGTGPYRAFTSDLTLSSVPAGNITQAANGTALTIGLGTNGNRCVVVKDSSGTVILGGSYTITLTVLDSLGASGTSTLLIKDNFKGGVGCL